MIPSPAVERQTKAKLQIVLCLFCHCCDGMGWDDGDGRRGGRTDGLIRRLPAAHEDRGGGGREGERLRSKKMQAESSSCARREGPVLHTTKASCGVTFALFRSIANERVGLVSGGAHPSDDSSPWASPLRQPLRNHNKKNKNKNKSLQHFRSRRHRLRQRPAFVVVVQDGSARGCRRRAAEAGGGVRTLRWEVEDADAQ